MGRGSKVEESLYPMVVGIKSSEKGIVVEAYGKPTYGQLKIMESHDYRMYVISKSIQPSPVSKYKKHGATVSITTESNHSLWYAPKGKKYTVQGIEPKEVQSDSVPWKQINEYEGMCLCVTPWEDGYGIRLIRGDGNNGYCRFKAAKTHISVDTDGTKISVHSYILVKRSNDRKPIRLPSDTKLFLLNESP